MVVATEYPTVPRLLLPRSDTTTVAGATSTVTEDDPSDPRFRRQLTVALGRSHSQRTPRRDVVFNVRQGRMLEKQTGPRWVGEQGRESATARQHDRDDEGSSVSRRAEATADSAFPPTSRPTSRYNKYYVIVLFVCLFAD